MHTLNRNFVLAFAFVNLFMSIGFAAIQEQELIICQKLSNSGIGTMEEFKRNITFKEKIRDVIETKGLGRLDDSKSLYGNGYHEFRLIGDDANLMYNTVKPLLEQNPIMEGGFVEKVFDRNNKKREKIKF